MALRKSFSNGQLKAKSTQPSEISDWARLA